MENILEVRNLEQDLSGFYIKQYKLCTTRVS